MNNILVNFKKEECCGCTACKSICPKQAITMKEDEKGFFYPFIDESKCVNCGLCIQTCDFRKFRPAKKQPTAYLFQLKDENDRMKSQSGGAFIALARYVISKGGCVFGCELDDNFIAIHTCYDSIDSIEKFRGSKYVQSNLKNTFMDCFNKLNEGKLVLFSGTGCQVHGLISFLKYKKCDTKKLITCDIVCHGCPSPKVFETYKRIIEDENVSKIVRLDFRSKIINGWHDHSERVAFDNKKTIETKKWTKLFYKHILFRDSCYNCKYTTIERLSDFTICDAWRNNHTRDNLDDNKGTSFVMCQSEFAKTIISELNDGKYRTLDFKEFENYIQPQFKFPPNKGDEYSLFWRKYSKNKKQAFRLLSEEPFLYRCIRKFKRLLWKRK